MKTFRKQPKDHLDYDLLLGNWLAEGDEIVSVDVVAPEGIEVTQIGVEPDRIKLWIKGGTTGQSYKFNPLIYTKSRVKEVDFMIIVVEM
ncbi:phage fiber-tail adaptor protein [Vreelandella aquamarina]|jgi:hypothetical protein|uniref:Uncharacterized protein n=1 Tax=Vreelandella aquamarina TaxID=77097 RepID=A0A6F8SUK5_9GAMM|nr:hypothetical protein [Halomonas meridiana]BCA91888.1 hypothetical protein HMSLTHF_16630 [Halomonas meridiana]